MLTTPHAPQLRGGTGGRADRLRRFAHSVLPYLGDVEFVDRVGRFVREGLARDEAVLVAEPTWRLEQLRAALGVDADRVEWLDMTEVGVNPGRIIPVWEDFVRRHTDAGRQVRGVGEPAWPGRGPAELDECRLHELLLNTAFGDGPAWQLACPYDVAGLPPEVVAEARRTHPWEGDGSRLRPLDHDPALAREAFEAALPPPPPGARSLGFDLQGIADVRACLAQEASSCGLIPERLEGLLLAGWEVAVNSIEHGGGRGLLRVWRQPDALVVQVEDDGVIGDPLVGRRSPRLEDLGGRGVFLAHQLCDLVQLRSSAAGTVVRLVTWL